MPEGELVPGDTNPLAAKIRKAIGAGPYEKVTVCTPQFERTDGKEITVFPKGAEFLDALKAAPADILKDCGLRRWDCNTWLFPGEWYDHIPDDYIVTDINAMDEPFKKGETSNDIRFGCLAYGIRHAHSQHTNGCKCPDRE